MKNIGHSSNCNMEIYMYLFAPSKPAQNFTLSIHLIFKISSLLIFVIPILKMSPKPKKTYSNICLGEVFFVTMFLTTLFVTKPFVTNIFFKSSNTMFATYCCHIFYVEKSPQSCTLFTTIIEALHCNPPPCPLHIMHGGGAHICYLNSWAVIICL